ncbi:FAD/NAD(P)-binding protein [Streptomyces sp. NPDC050516]|uniref:FAD/NAD(P)-binding protein n=1 Tax=Streptomyces sp. NPDC050516 TaxID=3365621 RepID=UPI0037A92FE1
MNTAVSTATPYTIAVVGTGPRGISVLERLAVHLMRDTADRRPVRIYAIDAVEVGAGRIWRTDQDDWFTMNTVIGQVTMFSGDPDGGVARPGAGPSLGQWLADQHPAPDGQVTVDEDDFASRRDYGRYLRYVYRTITDELPSHVRMIPLVAGVTSIRPGRAGDYVLTLDGDRELPVHKVVLATGHPRNDPEPFDQEMLDFADAHPEVSYLRGDSAADLDLDVVRPGSTVAVRGLGLSFYDVLLSLTVGRGGSFCGDGDGRLRYLPSGREPRIVAGSRSGLPIPPRGRNQKAPNHVHESLFLTKERLTAIRARREAESGSGLLDFNEDILPLVLDEIRHVYYTTRVRAISGEAAALDFGRRYTTALRTGHGEAALLSIAGLDGLPPLDLWALARPFAKEHFDTRDAWRERLLEVMRADLDEAELGTLDGPLKAALDTLRDLRGVLRWAIDYGGLRPHSHRDDFLNDYVPVNALLSAGPPMARAQQLMALMAAGTVEVAGPATEFTTDAEAGRFVVRSPQVAGSAVHAEVLIDARIPRPSLHSDVSPLTRQLLADGLIREFVNVDPASGTSFPTGGLDIAEGTFRALDGEGRVHPGLYALGVPTEHVRWFTQIGNSRPGLATDFTKVGEAVARDVMAQRAEVMAQAEATTAARAESRHEAVLAGRKVPSLG